MHFLDPRIDDPSLGRTRRTLAVAVGCLLLALSAAGGLALATWNVADPSLTHATSGPVRNLMGATGAAFADPLMQLLGLAAPILLLPLAVGGIRLARGRRPGVGPGRLLFLIGALALVPAGVAAVPAPGAWPLEIGLGGAVGHAHTVFLEETLGVRSGLEHALYGALAGGLGVFLLMRALAMPRERPPRARPEAGGIRVRRAHEATRRETAPADVIDDLGEEDPDDRSGRFAALAGALAHWLLAARARLRPHRRFRPRRAPTVDRPASAAAEPRRRRADPAAGRERLSGALAAAGPDFDGRAPAGTRVAGDGSGRARAPASGERTGRAAAPFARRGATAGVVEDPEPWDADASFAAALARRGGGDGRDDRVRRDPPRETAVGREARRPEPDRGSAGDAGRTGSRRPAAPDAAAPAGSSSGRARRPETAAAGERSDRHTGGTVEPGRERRADGSAARRAPSRVDPAAAAPGRVPTLFDVTPATPRPAPGAPAARPHGPGDDASGGRAPRSSTGGQKGGGVLTVPTRGPLSLLHRRRSAREAPAPGDGDGLAGEDVATQPSPGPAGRVPAAPADRGAPDEASSAARSDRETIRPAATGPTERGGEPDRTRRVDDEADAWLREAAVAETAESGPRPLRQRAGASAAGPAVRSCPDAADGLAVADYDDAAGDDRADGDGDGVRDPVEADGEDETTMEGAPSPRRDVAAEDGDPDAPWPAGQRGARTGDEDRGAAERHAANGHGADADDAHGCDADADDAPWDDADRDDDDRDEPDAAARADDELDDGADWSGETGEAPRAAGHRDDPAGWDRDGAWDDPDPDDADEDDETDDADRDDAWNDADRDDPVGWDRNDAWADADRDGAWDDADRNDAWDDADRDGAWDDAEDWDDSDDGDWPGGGADDRHAHAEGRRWRGDGPPPPPAETTRVVPPAPAMKPGRRIVREAQPSLLSPEEYEFPSLHLLAAPTADALNDDLSPEALEQNARILEGVLEDFGVRGEIINVRPGPVVTLYELEPAPGIKSARVIGLADDIARSMSAISARVAVIPGKNAIGIELPNQRRITVFLRELLASADFERTKARLPLCLGKTIGGEAVIADLARMPHLLVAGTTGSGKSVSINTMVLSLLYRLRPDQCRLIMIDPKMLELSIYDSIPHLLTPVVTDPKKAVVALKWAVREMEDRYRKMAKLGVRNVDGFNNRLAEARRKGEELTRLVQTGFDHHTGEAIFEEETLELEPLPYIVILVDEMADLMLVAGKDIEGTIQRLAQMARAAGIHLIMATQRPSVDVITGTIKANFPTRISFQVTSKIDSRTILGEMGAEQLLGMGDMLYMAGGGRIQRVHGPFVSDEEVEDVVAHLKRQGAPDYRAEVTEDDEEDGGGSGGSGGDSGGGGEGEDLYDRAVAIVLRDRKASTSYIQRRLSIGYNRAASLIERMEDEGVVGPANHAGKREILVPAREEETV